MIRLSNGGTTPSPMSSTLGLCVVAILRNDSNLEIWYVIASVQRTSRAKIEDFARAILWIVTNIHQISRFANIGTAEIS